jgi:hypothetical protein
MHLAHLVTVKLNPDNYLVWRAQVLPLLRSYYLDGYVDGSFPCPPPMVHVLAPDGTPMALQNPAHRQWTAQDQAILSAIPSSLMPTVAGMVLFAATSHQAWSTLDSSFSSQAMARSMDIRNKLGDLKKLDKLSRPTTMRLKSWPIYCPRSVNLSVILNGALFFLTLMFSIYQSSLVTMLLFLYQLNLLSVNLNCNLSLKIGGLMKKIFRVWQKMLGMLLLTNPSMLEQLTLQEL